MLFTDVKFWKMM